MHQFLKGVPASHVLDRLEKSGGNEVGSGKLASPDSSAALAVNCFGWFIERPAQFPPLPGTEQFGPAEIVDVEFCARFPWSGGSHPWLDAVVVTPEVLICVESKRHEPFRDKKRVDVSPAYDRPVWGERMHRYEELRDGLRSGDMRFSHLDAAQLLKHAFGLVTEGRRQQRRPVLYYLYSEPSAYAGKGLFEKHRREIDQFADMVSGDEVAFLSSSYGEWLASWQNKGVDMADHRRAVIETYRP